MFEGARSENSELGSVGGVRERLRLIQDRKMDAARSRLVRTGEYYPPSVFSVFDDGRVERFECLATDADERSVIGVACSSARERGARGMVLVFEGWTGRNRSVRPTDDPERGEAIVSIAVAGDGWCRTSRLIFGRGEDGTPVPGAVDVSEREQSSPDDVRLLAAFWDDRPAPH